MSTKPKPRTKTLTFTFEIDLELYKELRWIARRDGVTFKSLIEEGLYYVRRNSYFTEDPVDPATGEPVTPEMFKEMMLKKQRETQ